MAQLKYFRFSAGKVEAGSRLELRWRSGPEVLVPDYDGHPYLRIGPKGVDRAQASGGVFHLWFHPSNFWHDMDAQFATFDRFAALLADRAGRGEIAIKPMAAFA